MLNNVFVLITIPEIAKLRKKMINERSFVKTKQLDEKVTMMVKEVILNFLIVLVMMCVAYISYDPNMYLQNSALKSKLFSSEDSQVSDKKCSNYFIFQLIILSTRQK